MHVLKFGGTSIANAESIKKTVSIITRPKYSRTIVVVSAFSGVTDQLIRLGVNASEGDEAYKNVLTDLEKKHIDAVKDLLPVNAQSGCISNVKQSFNELEDICEGVFKLGEISGRTKDRIVSFGELLSSKIISYYLQSLNVNHTWVDTREVIKTNSNFGSAVVDFDLTYEKIKSVVKSSSSGLLLAPGFIASDSQGHITTLGRGGSDYTAALFASGVDAEALEIWTDVTGMMTADPRWVNNARTIKHISYREAMELSHFGAKVIYASMIQPAIEKNIPIWVKNTFAPDEDGTVIEETAKHESEIATGISSINEVALLSLEGSGMAGVPRFSKRLFEALAAEKINVILITQSSSEHSISVAINTADAHRAKRVVDEAFEIELHNGKIEPLKVEEGLSVIALVGDKMKSHHGVSGKMFSALGRNGINIRAISQGSSERNISTVISFKDVKKGVNILHEEFFETSLKQINIFIAGVGNVGSKLIEQLKQQQQYLLENLGIQVRVVGIANSKNVLINEEGIDLNTWKNDLGKASPMKLEGFLEAIISRNLRNSVFADITSSEEVAGSYFKLLMKSISVVACNKIAASSSYKNYQRLKLLAKEYSVPFLFETNVGAGLPVISTLNDLIKSGDKVNKIQAVLSGTLNFVFNNYDGKKLFADVVKQAQDEGYTEPDPRLDLGGTDVMRKIMILAREAGEPLEMNEIANNGFLPASCFDGTVADFYTEMKKHEAHFKKLYDEAAAKNCKLKFVASYENGKASVGLQHIPSNSDFYHLYGKDNIVLFYTKRYPEQPLVVKGAGAGADVTASGVFADIMRVAV